MSARSSSLVVGLRIGGYELVRRIGRGGMAEVWCAKKISSRRTSKFVAIKVVADQYVGDPRFQRMFRAEAELSGLLNHANIVQVFDEGEDAGRSYLVMEWVDGVNLLKIEAALTFIDDEPWKHKLIAYIVGQLLHALGYAHGVTLHDGNPLGIVHRDVSPQNVLVSNHGEVKLTDFGVAHHLLEESSGLHVKGKVRYMSPDQLSGQGRDPRIDLYAVGAILHEMLDGRRFRHHVEDQREMYLEVLSGHVPALGRAVPPELETLRCALLRPDPKDRPPNAEAALELLERFPGYGDARRDLAQLCAGLTGVMRPRVGPGTSQMYVAASASPGAEAVAAPSPSPSPAASSAPAASAPEPIPAGSSVGLQPPPSPAPAAFLPPPTPAPASSRAQSQAPGRPWDPPASPTASPSSNHPDAEPTSPEQARAKPEGQPSVTLRLTRDAIGAPEPIVGDSNPLPSSGPRGTGTVQGEVDDIVGGSGALIGGGAQRGAPYDVPPDTSVMTPSMIRKIVEPSGPSVEVTDSQREVSTLTSLGPRTIASSPGSTMVASRRPWRGTSVAMLISFFLLGSAGMLGVFLMWGDALVGPTNEIVDGRAQQDAPNEPERPGPPNTPPEETKSIAVASPTPELAGSTGSGSTSSGSSGDAAEDGEPSSGTSGSPEDAEQGSSSTTAEGEDDEAEPPAPPPQESHTSKPKPKPIERSGLIVAVDGSEPLMVRVGSGKSVLIESRKSHAFRVPVGKGRKVQWKRKADASWSSARVDIKAKCELQLRVPSQKTMTIGTCQ